MPDERYYRNISKIVGEHANEPRPERAPEIHFPRRQSVLKAVKWAAISAVVCVMVLYLVDTALFHYRWTRGHGALGAFTVDRFSAIQEKNNRTEYDFTGAENKTCSHSIFPHSGYSPCWYLSRHRDVQVQM